jgi:hypothetical protein
MVEHKKGTVLTLCININLGAISASMFVGKCEGKLRDYYRIGKILGTGMLNHIAQSSWPR